jgi:extracellular elastinolytic metalloproteinase
MRIAYVSALRSALVRGVLGLLGAAAVATPAPAAAQQARVAADAVTAHFRHHAADFAASGADLADLAVTDAYTDSRTGTSYVYLRQRVNGVEVYNATALAAVTRAGEIYGASASFVSGAASRAAAPEPALSAADAVRAAALRLGVEGSGALALLREVPGVPGGAVFSGDGFSAEPISVRLVYVATAAGPVRLAWDLTIDHRTRSREVADGVIVPGVYHVWSVRVDAATGALLDVVDLVAHDHWGTPAGRTGRGAFDFAPLAAPAATGAPAAAQSGSYRVVALPAESPSHGSFSLVSLPHNPVASPTGWHLAGTTPYTITRGNNVHAYDDVADTNTPGSSPDGGAALLFDFPFDPMGSPTANLDAAITSLFYWNNIIHDVSWHYGFDEAAGNFQQVNATGQGSGFDYVQAEALDGSGTNNANFFTPSDGQRPRMQMYEWTAGAGFTVTAPAPAAGTYPNQPAGFGPGPPTPAITVGIVPVDDGFGGTLGCEVPANAAEIAGNFALIERGGCEFGVKVRNAIDAGAIGAIVYNCEVGLPGCSATSADELVSMGPGVTDPALLTIPATFVQRNTGVVMAANPTGLTATYGALGPNRDSDFDAGVIMHEYGHGISNRLVGGPANVSCLGNQEQMGEGWSDYYGLLITMRAGDTGPQRRGVGTYLGYEANDGGGIRNAPYSTDFGVNDYTYQDVITGGGTTLSIPHGIGFAWATMLWEMTWELVGTNGWSDQIYNASGMAGNQVALRLVTEGLKLTACSPGFVDGRNAILAADQALYGGAHALQIWTAFARRGLGNGASQGFSSSVNDGNADFTIPPGVASEPGAGGAVAVVGAPRPNPAAGTAALSVELPRAEAVRVELFDALGRRVALAHDGELAAGVRHEVALQTAGLAPGVYVWRVSGESFAESGRLTVLR